MSPGDQQSIAEYLEGALVYYCWDVDYTVDYGRPYLLDETCCFMWYSRCVLDGYVSLCTHFSLDMKHAVSAK